MKHLREIFDDALTRAAGVVFVLIVGLVLFDIYSDAPEDYPLFGVVNFSMVPVLFVAGGLVFILSILRLARQDEEYIEWHRGKLLFLMFGGATGILLLVVGGFQLVEFMDSTAFCGELCHHVMYPEFTAYKVSPHSRVKCTECHVGAGADYMVKSKLSGLPLVMTTLTGTYDRPIPTPVENLRPARATCEECHRPERFAGDLVRVHTTYGTDEANSQKIDTRVLRVGGGEFEVARDIHWHTGARVWYLPMDEKRQEIGWVGVQNGATLEQYVDPQRAAEITTERVVAGERLMDCVDCHNRPTHIFHSPNELIDAALAQGKMDPSLPFLKREGLRALDPPNASLEQALAKVEAIGDFYRVSYPEVSSEKEAVIAGSVEELKRIARLTTFPEMNVDWRTYVSNMGHQQSPGCFRCHGKLVATSGERTGEPIDAGCDLCHYILPE